MLRLRLHELIDELNRRSSPDEHLYLKDVADSLGVARTTFSCMTTFAGERATNTAIVEALVRYFHRRLPGFDFRDMFEFGPALGTDTPERVDELYPVRAARNRPQS